MFVFLLPQHQTDPAGVLGLKKFLRKLPKGISFFCFVGFLFMANAHPCCRSAFHLWMDSMI